MRDMLFVICMATGFFAASAGVPAGYYSQLEGKSGTQLREAVRKVALPADFVSIGYGMGHTSFKTWQAFEFTDVRTINGKKAWWDMYSNRLVYVESGVSSLNIEHSVANSWWGGQGACDQAYQDLFHLNPSNAEANGKKSNNPLGVVGTNPAYDNGMILVGSPASGYGGGASTVFEPADEYKGDFARAYFYIFTAYDAISWRTDKGGERMYSISGGRIDLQPWAAQMLLKWAKDDPVDDKEISRNEEIYRFQKNRNPFIDYPALADYIWGDRKGYAFTLEGNGAEACNRPSDPVALDARLTDVNTYSVNYWGDREICFALQEGDLWISLDGGSYQRYGDRIKVPAGNVHGTEHRIKAYALKEDGDRQLRSSIVTVNLTVKDPSVADYTDALWEPVRSAASINADGYYIVLAADNRHVMGCQATTFMPDCGFAEFAGNDKDGDVAVIPQSAALVRFVPVSGGTYTLAIYDTHGAIKGYWASTTVKKMKLQPSQGTAATVSIGDDNTAVITFGSYGSLQYNKSNPRFLNYDTSQGKVMLYRFKRFVEEGSSVDETGSDGGRPVVVSGRDIIVPDGGVIYDLNGRRVSGTGLQPGLYVVVTRAGAEKVLVR